ncbi:Mob1/phocein [Fimicolochytrium jonesii]|uniref:Mob1/phocein n=1 Tax=Fimicolochytrium jonesii TaxID=1396493 RepID=UPI0022FE10F0|nr:Mob1/phocein [Fimicolochytrium jonesii]KAI8821068.1 Mob1/phocein [Fimicolochytrium jonesii]
MRYTVSELRLQTTTVRKGSVLAAVWFIRVPMLFRCESFTDCRPIESRRLTNLGSPADAPSEAFGAVGHARHWQVQTFPLSRLSKLPQERKLSHNVKGRSCTGVQTCTRGNMEYQKFMGHYEGKTFRAKKQFFQGTKRDQIQKYIVKTLGGNDIWAVVEVPPNTSREEWIAVNTVDFYNQINLLYGCISEYCTRESCPSMTAGPRYEYLWADGITISKPIKCSASEYVEHLLAWVDTQLDDENTFPPTDSFPPHFMPTVKKIFQRLFRFYAHAYHNHLKQLEEVGEDRHLNTCFKHFILFVTEYDLIDSKELQPLQSIANQILEQNPRRPAGTLHVQ